MGLGDVKDDVDIGGTVASWKTGIEGSVEVLLQELVGDVGRSGHRGLDLGGTLVAEYGKSERVVEVRITARSASSSATGTWSTDPIVRNGLVGSNDDRVPLGDEDIELIDNEGIALNTIGFDDGHVVTVDREAVEGTASDVDDTETVALPALDIDDGEWHLGTTLEATNTVNEDGIRNWYDGCLVVHLLQQRSLLVVIVGKGDDSGEVINVVHMFVRVVGVVDDQCATETIAVLGGVVGVIPERASLLVEGEGVEESRVGGNWALGNKSGTVVTVGPVLEETMPVNRRTSPHTRVDDVVVNVQVQLVELVRDDHRARGCAADGDTAPGETIIVDGPAFDIESHVYILCPREASKEG